MNFAQNENLSDNDGTRKLVPTRAKNDLPQVVDAVSIAPTQNIKSLQAQVEQVRAATAVPASTALRRLLFIWLRIYVSETKRGKETKVNIAVPIPIPVVGALFRRQLNWTQALRAVNLAPSADGAQVIESYLQSCMGLELIRVEEEQPESGKKELVVIGFD